jgi:hypothetical protein
MIRINKIALCRTAGTIAATFAGATALALMLAGALGSKPMAVTPTQASTQTAPATAIRANELRTVFDGTLPKPAIAVEQSAAPDPLASLDPADRAIAEKIRDLLATKLDRFFVTKKERAAALAFHQDRNLAPLWLDKGVENKRATSVIARIKNADAAAGGGRGRNSRVAATEEMSLSGD